MLDLPRSCRSYHDNPTDSALFAMKQFTSINTDSTILTSSNQSPFYNNLLTAKMLQCRTTTDHRRSSSRESTIMKWRRSCVISMPTACLRSTFSVQIDWMNLQFVSRSSDWKTWLMWFSLPDSRTSVAIQAWYSWQADLQVKQSLSGSLFRLLSCIIFMSALIYLSICYG